MANVVYVVGFFQKAVLQTLVFYSNTDPNTLRRWGSLRTASTGRRPSSNSLASQLYHSSSFGRGDSNQNGRMHPISDSDLYSMSDISLEDDVLDLSHKVQILQKQVSALAENQTGSDDRYTKAKQENAALATRLQLLEEQIRDVEIRGEEKLEAEKKKAKDIIARIEREKHLELENFTIRCEQKESELKQIRDELTRCQQNLERERMERRRIEQQLIECETNLQTMQSQYDHSEQELKKERGAHDQILKEVGREMESLRLQYDELTKRNRDILSNPNQYNIGNGFASSEQPSRMIELEAELKRLKQENAELRESQEELQMTVLNRGFEEGCQLLNGISDTKQFGTSLAAEFEALGQDDIKRLLREQQDVNGQLRSYIDGILLNIVENYPQLLEVKRKP